MKRFNFTYFLVEGCRSIVTHGLMSFAAICMTVCCLLIMGSFALVAVNADAMLGDWEDENIILAYVDETLGEEQTQALKQTLEAVPNVTEVTFVSKETAMAAFREEKESNELFDDLPASVLRDRYQIQVDDLALMNDTVDQLGEVSGIANLRTNPEVTEGFLVVRNIAGVVAMILIIVLLLVSLFIISNTIRLATFHRREEIAIMKMCGATDWFVRWPFIIEGMLHGLIGAVVAFFLEWGIYGLVEAGIGSSDTLQLITVLPFASMAPLVLLAFVVTGLVIGVLGSILAIGKFLQV